MIFLAGVYDDTVPLSAGERDRRSWNFHVLYKGGVVTESSPTPLSIYPDQARWAADVDAVTEPTEFAVTVFVRSRALLSLVVFRRSHYSRSFNENSRRFVSRVAATTTRVFAVFDHRFLINFFFLIFICLFFRNKNCM